MTNPNATRLANIGARAYAARQPGAKPAPPTPAPSAKVAQRKPAPSPAAKSAAALEARAKRRYGTAEPAYD